MKTMLASFLLASFLGMPIQSALAQDAVGTPGGTNGLPSAPLTTPAPDAPSPETGELVPPPGPPPEGAAATIKLPDCTPPKCGVPQIMSE